MLLEINVPSIMCEIIPKYPYAICRNMKGLSDELTTIAEAAKSSIVFPNAYTDGGRVATVAAEIYRWNGYKSFV